MISKSRLASRSGSRAERAGAEITRRAESERVEARTRSHKGRHVVIGAKSRMGRVRVATQRCFVVSRGQPILVRDVLMRCYPRQKRFRSRQYDLARCALR